LLSSIYPQKWAEDDIFALFARRSKDGLFATRKFGGSRRRSILLVRLEELALVVVWEFEDIARADVTGFEGFWEKGASRTVALI